MATSKNSLKKDKELEELDERIIRKIESYIDEKLKPILDKIREKIEHHIMNFL